MKGYVFLLQGREFKYPETLQILPFDEMWRCFNRVLENVVGNYWNPVLTYTKLLKLGLLSSHCFVSL